MWKMNIVYSKQFLNRMKWKRTFNEYNRPRPVDSYVILLTLVFCTQTKNDKLIGQVTDSILVLVLLFIIKLLGQVSCV